MYLFQQWLFFVNVRFFKNFCKISLFLLNNLLIHFYQPLRSLLIIIAKVFMEDGKSFLDLFDLLKGCEAPSESFYIALFNPFLQFQLSELGVDRCKGFMSIIFHLFPCQCCIILYISPKGLYNISLLVFKPSHLFLDFLLLNMGKLVCLSAFSFIIGDVASILNIDSRFSIQIGSISCVNLIVILHTDGISFIFSSIYVTCFLNTVHKEIKSRLTQFY